MWNKSFDTLEYYILEIISYLNTSFPRVELPVPEVVLLPASSANVKNTWSYISSPYVFMDNFIFIMFK
jgi:hypothetical protein